MNYNLKKLFKNESIPELSNLIVDELKEYGVCKYTDYLEDAGGYHLNLECEVEPDLEAVKQIILKHDAVKVKEILRIKDIDQKREQEYSQKVDKLVIEKIRKQLKDVEIDAIVSEIQAKYPKEVK